MAQHGVQHAHHRGALAVRDGVEDLLHLLGVPDRHLAHTEKHIHTSEKTKKGAAVTAPLVQGLRAPVSLGRATHD
jgi:hypothetical protein